MTQWLRLCIGATLAAAAHLSHALTAAQLQEMLKAPAVLTTRYEESRDSPWLSAPVTTRGTLRATSEALEKRVEWPREETWTLRNDRAEWIGPAGTSHKQILYSQAPDLQLLANVSRRAVVGDLAALARDFNVTVAGDERVWSARLQPRTPALARLVDSVELQGSGNRLRVLIVVERQGERTTTRLLP